MKKFKSVLLLAICIVFLSGCVKSHTTMGIKKDKSMSYETELLFSNLLSDDMTSFIDSEEYEKSGYKVTVVTDEGYKGVKITKKFKNIDDFSNNKGEEVVISDFLEKDFNRSLLFQRESSFLKDTYKAKFKYSINTSEYEKSMSENENSTEEASDSEELTDENVENYMNLMSEMEFTFNITLPYKAISNNASDVSENGRSLKWNIGVDGQKDIEFEFSILNMSHIIMLGGGVILLIILLFVVLMIIRHKKATKDTLIHKDYDPSVESIVNPNGQNIK